MRQKQLVVALAGVMGLALAADVAALSDTTNIGDSWKGWNLQKPDATEQGIETDTAWFYPSVSAKMVIDDNYYNQRDNKVSATLVTVTPRIQVEFEGDTTMLRATAELDYQYNFHDTNDNQWGIRTVGELGWEPTEKLSLQGGLGWELGHEPRGTGIAEGPAATQLDEPVEYQEWTVRLSGDYGTDEEGAPKLNFEAARSEREYTNYELITSSRDRVSHQLGGSFLYWLQPNTAMNLSARYFDISYDDGAFDSTHWRYLLGLQWDASYQTQGYAQVGWSEKDMRDATLIDGSAMNWEVGVRWRPTTLSMFVLSASRDFVEEDYAGYGDMMEYRLAWKHQWESYLDSNLIFNLGTKDYPMYLDSQREDEFWDLELGVQYRARPWLSLGASARHSDRKSNLSDYSFTENVYSLTMDMTFY